MTVLHGNHLDHRNAALLALAAMNAIRRERLRRNHPFDTESDPAHSGLIGRLTTPVTTRAGHLSAKRTSVNPNFAAVVVELLTQAGVRRGHAIAVGYSGSFPAMNICVCAAVEALGLKPVVIASGSSSQWGANDPDFLWIDMENLLFQKGIFSFRSIAASLGSIDDTGEGLPREGRQLIRHAIQRNGLTPLEPASLKESITQRMALYRRQGVSIKAYVNVGGGAASIGRRGDRRAFKEGLNWALPPDDGHGDSVAHRFIREGIPVIDLKNVVRLAKRYHLPVEPKAFPRIAEELLPSM